MNLLIHNFSTNTTGHVTSRSGFALVNIYTLSILLHIIHHINGQKVHNCIMCNVTFVFVVQENTMTQFCSPIPGTFH